MILSDLAIPTLPSRNLQETAEFYGKLGFENCSAPDYADHYLILRWGTIELHFFHLPDIVPAESYAGCYLRVSQVEPLFHAFQTQSLPCEGIPRLGALEDKAWGMREFSLVDSSGNLIRIGQVIAAGAPTGINTV